MQNAYAYEHGTESKSTTLSKGYADVIIHGPNNKEEWINVEFFYSGKKMSQDKFNNSGHNITVKRKDGERSGVYSANVPTQTVTTSAIIRELNLMLNIGNLNMKSILGSQQIQLAQII